MKTVTAFQCEICDHFDMDKQQLQEHEQACIEQRDYEIQKKYEQDVAKHYLDSFRLRAKSVRHLLNLIETEMDQIIAAYKVVYMYDVQDKKVSRLSDFTYKHHAFASPSKPAPHPMSHSAPVKYAHLSYEERNNPDSRPEAFELEIIYKVEQHLAVKNILDAIGGINTGSGGNWHKGSYHYYCTFWLSDFPNGLPEF
ncbi:hypothetical protein [Vibrio crassostreae]|uniref:hypothetical protein n=1 Tax=Vibrio crassostreae TaxID=246167 RepID=UPI001B30C916|nr:hypothetical protein [Vibrio crassostreae]